MRLLASLGAFLLATTATPAFTEPQLLNSVGSPEAATLTDALFARYTKLHPEVRKGPLWAYPSDARAIGALMFETADFAAILRGFDRNELAPYEHQFRGDMMKAPEMVAVARHGGATVWFAANRRPGAPYDTAIHGFLSFVLSEEGQKLVAAQPGYAALSPAKLAQSRSGLDFFVAPLDPQLLPYHARTKVAGPVSSVGSDGMKSLMERWMDGFIQRQPGVRRGSHWEHLGTLNGFHAILNGLADMAPMGRELWPQEQTAYQAVVGDELPIEIRVARGGFNTPQRTTAQAVWVNAANPLDQIAVNRLAEVLKHDPTIRTWGQLGLTGEWANRPIHIFMPPAVTPNAMSMQQMVLHGAAWGDDAHEGSIADTAAAIAGDPAAIGFGGFEEGGPSLKALAVARNESATPIAATYETTASGAYPLTRYMYIRLRRPIAPQTREFLRYILSREGQSPVRFSAYFPLSAREAAEELAKLDHN